MQVLIQHGKIYIMKNEIAARPTVARNDKGIQVIALPFGLAMTYIKSHNFGKGLNFERIKKVIR